MSENEKTGGMTAATCPVDHAQFSHQKSLPASYRRGTAAVEQGADGVWHIHGFAEGRDLLRSGKTRQAGFGAEMILQAEHGGMMTNLPILYQEGEPHNEQRRRAARFFTPTTVGAKYRDFMETFSGELIAPLRLGKTVDLSRISMALAVQVAARVVGLTNSRLPGMEGRLEMFFHHQHATGKRGLFGRLSDLYSQRDVLAFFFIDVQPAIKARRKQAEDDVISSLISQGYSDADILTEVITYAAAGMATTREFICMAAWHLLDTPALLERYCCASEKERYAILHEALRMEPVITALRRRAEVDLPLQSEGRSLVIPAGSELVIDIYGTNLDESATGANPELLCPDREIQAASAQPMLLSFGDGAHRCPGSYMAIQETDIFLQQLFGVDGLHIIRPPKMTVSPLTQGYEVRDFLIGVG